MGGEHSVIAVELCGKMADLAASPALTEIPVVGCDVTALLAAVAAQHKALAPELAKGRILACVNETVCGPDGRVMPGDEVALFPPVSGG